MVTLTTQVLSESVHKALVATGGEAAQGTAHFVIMMDRFFDCLNVNSFTAGKHKRKPFQNPYRSGLDFRLKVFDCMHVSRQLFDGDIELQWLEDDFIGYLDAWEESVQALHGFTKTQKNKMLLSPETRLGLRTTGKQRLNSIVHNYSYITYTFYINSEIICGTCQISIHDPGCDMLSKRETMPRSTRKIFRLSEATWWG